MKDILSQSIKALNQKNLLDISVVCPIYNEEGNVEELHKKILESLEKIGKSFEVIFIDDGSSDNTYNLCKNLKPLILIRFRKNFGQTAALDCGFKKAQGKVVISLDGDLQNNPADFPLLLNKLEEGFDVVAGWRKNRKDPLSKIFLSRGADFLRKFLIDDGIHDSGCTLKAYRRECFDNLDLFGEMHRFIPAVLKIQGFSVTEVVVKHHPRLRGVSKYGFTRTIKGFLDMLSVWFWKKYAHRPLHLFGGVGIFLMLGGIFLLIGLLMARFLYSISLSDKIWPLIAVFMMLMGGQLFVSGLLADIAIKNYYQGENKNYVIKSEEKNV